MCDLVNPPYRIGCRREQEASGQLSQIRKLSHACDGGRAILLALEGVRAGEIAFKSPHTYYKAVSGGSEDS